MASNPPDLTAEIDTTASIELGPTLSVVKNARVDRDRAWWAPNTPDGPAMLAIQQRTGRIELAAWGPGSEWAIAQAPELLGSDDDSSAFEPHHRIVRDLHLRHAGLRLGATNRWFEAAVIYTIGQMVVRADAVQSRRLLARRHGPPAPGAGLVDVLPDPETVARMSYSDFHLLNLERKRAQIIKMLAGHATRLERLGGQSNHEAASWLQRLPGIGPWTTGYVTATAGGDPDAVPVGDYHLPRTITYALTGTAERSDEAMLAALEPYAGQRQRVVRLLKLSGVGPPRRAPRMARRDFRRL